MGEKGQEKQQIWGNISFPGQLCTASKTVLRGSGRDIRGQGEVVMEVQAEGH